MTGDLLVAVVAFGAVALFIWVARRLFRTVEPACRCGHLGLAHEHYRSGDRREECALCPCERWEPAS